MTSDAGRAAEVTDVDVAIVGAGFSGLYAAHRLRSAGFSVQVIERGNDVGGTWYWNRYPGARCDIESVDYSYGFSRELRDEWVWTERYATQPEILRYLEHVADRFDLRRDIRFGTTVTSATFDDAATLWRLRTDDGELTARFCVLGVGNLSEPKRPDLPGLDEFTGEWHHTARWPAEGVDVTGRTVGVIGTGSTGIQAIPQLAARADKLYVFQRTPAYSMPARNRPLPPEELADVNAGYEERRRLCEWSESGVPTPPAQLGAFDVDEATRQTMYEAGWERGGINALSYAFTDFFSDAEANRTAQDFAREKIAEIVADPVTAAALQPRHHIGTRRTCVDTGYFETYNRANVELVDVRADPITSLTPAGVATASREYAVDVLIFAIGFDAMTGAIEAIDIVGRDGVSLREAWSAGPRTFLGLATAGFPNLFMVTGPGSPSVLSNMVVSIEQHVDWIADCLEHLRATGAARIEATPEAQDAWVAHVNELADETLYPQATSWYLGANIPGKPRVFMPYVGGCGEYRRECDAVAASGYAGFEVGAAASATASEAEGARA